VRRAVWLRPAIWAKPRKPVALRAQTETVSDVCGGA
jgi:hypothetical protein